MSSRSTFFISDLHLGAPEAEASRQRERLLLRWIEQVAPRMEALYLVGDTFDFWFEYRRAVPRGHLRFLGALAALADAGVSLHLFTGNHDHWFRDYLAGELGAEILRQPLVREVHGRRLYIAHGDGLGPGDQGYKLLKRVLTHPLPQWLFARLHPDAGIGLARFVSGLGDHAEHYAGTREETHLGEGEFLYAHARAVYAQHPGLFACIFGHRHILIDDELSDGRRIVLLGDWIQYFSYLEVSSSLFELQAFHPAS